MGAPVDATRRSGQTTLAKAAQALPPASCFATGSISSIRMADPKAPFRYCPVETPQSAYARMEVGMSPEPGNTTEIPPAEAHLSVSGRRPIGPSSNPPAPPRFATFTMDNFGISDTRSRHNDTDFVYLSATVGANPPVFVVKSMGDVNNGTHSVGLSLEVDIPDDDTI